MVRRKREAKASTVGKISNSVIADATENNIRSEAEVQTIEEAGKENNATPVGKVDGSGLDATDREIMHEEHAEEAEVGLGDSKEEAGKGEECDVYDDDNGDKTNADIDDHDNDDADFPNDEDGDDDFDDDDNDDHDDEDGDDDDDDEDCDDAIAADDDNDTGDDDFDDLDDEDGDDDGFHESDENDYDDEKDDKMGEEEIDENAKLVDDDSITELSDDSKRITEEEGKQEENAKEKNEDGKHRNLKKKVPALRRWIKGKEITAEESDEMVSKNKGKQEEGQGDAVEETDKENAKEENEDKEDESLKKKVKTLRRGKKRKKITLEVSDKMVSKRNDLKEDGRADRVEEEDAKDDIQEKAEHSKQKVRKLSKKRSKVETGAFEKVALKQDDKGESSRRKKSSKKVKSMGMIFMCSSKTKKDCYHYKVLGLPANKRDVVQKIYKGMRLFLYDFDLKLMYGIYKAAGPGGFNIEPRAFNSQFPAQVRFTVVNDCLPLAEEKFKKAIKDNYFTKTKFDCQLTSQQVKNLCKLFVSVSKGSKGTRLARRKLNHPNIDQERNRAQGEERRSARNEKHQRRERNRRRRREAAASPVALVPPAPSAPRLLLPAAAPIPLYAYDRSLELEAYRRDLFVKYPDPHRHPVPEPRDLFVKHPDPHRHPVPEPRDAYRRAPVLEHPDAYRRDPPLHHPDSYRRDIAVEHLDLRLRDEIGRRDSYISYRERPEQPDHRSRDDLRRHDLYFPYGGSSGDHNLRSQVEIGRHDPYVSYREPPTYRDRLYDTASLPEHDGYRPVLRSIEYDPLPAEYRSARPLYRY